MNKSKTVLFYIRTAVTLCLIAGIMAALLAGVNEFTSDRIEAAKKAEREAAIEEIFGEVDIEKISTGECDECIDAIYKVIKDGTLVGYAALCTPAGYGGKEIEMMVGLSVDKTVKDVLVMADNQTVGIGDKVRDESWLSRYDGKSEETVPEDTIAGATKSSSAVNEAVRAVLSLEIEEEGGSDK